MKKLFNILLISLISGILLVGYSNAMTYTVQGERTQIKIPKNPTNENIVINRGDGDTTPITSCSEDTLSDGVPAYYCQKTYSENETYTVTIANPDNKLVKIMFLAEANVKSITDFNGFNSLTTIWLNGNNIQNLSNNIFGNFSNNSTTIYLDYNLISDYTSYLTKIGTLYLTHNQLTTIPSIIRDNRSTFDITLDSSTTFGNNGAKLIDLSNNQINFVGITEVNGTDTSSTYCGSYYGYCDFNNKTSYDFEWFGYSYNTSPLTYKYEINEITGTEDIKGTTTNTGVTIDKPLDAGNYTFKVCMNDSTEYCDTFEFSVSYTEKLFFNTGSTHPNSNGTDLDSIDGIKFSRGKTGNYPEEFLNGYTYSLKKGDSYIIPETTPLLSKTNLDSVSIPTDDPNGTYLFTVKLKNKNGDDIDTIARTFTITIDDTITIEEPRQTPSYTGEGVTSVTVPLKWSTANSLFNNYSYYITTNNDCTLTNIVKSGSNINEKDFSGSVNLGGGEYYLCVTMDGDKQGKRKFSVNIPSTLTINSPSAGLKETNNITFDWTGFAEHFDHYKYTLVRSDGGIIKSGTGNKEFTGFDLTGLHHGTYTFTIYIENSSDETIEEREVSFRILDDQDLAVTITSNGTTINTGGTIKSKTATFTWDGRSEDFSGYYYAITGTTFTGSEYSHTGIVFGNTNGNITLDNLVTGKYKFSIKMLSGNNLENDIITGLITNFNVEIPASLTIISPSEGAKIESATATVSWTGYNDTKPLYSYMIKKGSTVLDTSNLTDNTSFTRTDFSNGSYSVTVYMLSGWAEVATKTVNFTVDIPVKSSGGGGGSSSKSHPTNNLKLSIGNESPSANEWIELIVKINDKYTGKVTFPKIQYYSGDNEKWIDIPVTSKNFVSDYSDDAKLGYVRFSSDDDGKKILSQFIKFAKNGHYRIYAEDKDGYDTYVQLQIGPKKVEVTTGHNAAPDTEEEIYIARSCKKYTIIYSDTLNIYTSPNLNISEFFMNKDYLKRYLDSKNRYQSGCPTNIGWITTSYVDRTNDDERYTAPNGKVYFIVGEEGDYYSNELNRELKTPTSFKSIQELKFYIRDRNPLINMAALGPVS